MKSITLIGNLNFRHRSLAWSSTLNQLGHKVTCLPEPLSNMSNILRYRVQKHLLIGPDFSSALKQTKNDILALKNEINIFHKSLAFGATDISYISENSSSLNILYNNDNVFGPLSRKLYFRKLKSAISKYDLILAYRHSDIQNYYSAGAKNVYHLMSYYLPEVHFPYDFENRNIDLCFLGHYENDSRNTYVKSILTNIDANFILKGVDWDKSPIFPLLKDFDTSPVYFNDYADFLRNSKIGLCFLSKLNLDTYTRRVFEIPACGAMLLSERTDVLQELYTEDKEAIYFSSTDELIDKVNFYLKNDHIRLKIARNGYNRCISSNYDIKSRLTSMFSFIDKLL